MRSWRKLLLPLSWIYGIVIYVRNCLFDAQVLKSVSYEFPLICIGNLSVGGTGKTPMTEYVVTFLKEKYKVAILSRGYKRATKGFVLAAKNVSVRDIGDEPFQYYHKLKGVTVAVDEDRRHGIRKLEAENVEVIVLDDAFQHRKVKAGLNILLSTYSELYTDDFLLPAGNLRDLKSQAKRADVVVVTKCPEELNVESRKEIVKKLKIAPHQEVYFSRIAYSDTVRNTAEAIGLDELNDKEITLVTGIAHPRPLLEYLKNEKIHFKHQVYADHHNFTTSEIESLKKKPFVLTTEKDFVRLEPYLENLYYLPITTAFLADEKNFQARILNFTTNNS
ncbi:tetraacyldisaccharide 4'-kinase [Galbibacter pacificus]|uniref:Tetraacyldisaccharide 4'-kinase n=1 Tax=Galbibacter pacificus TaxID=2996052 RepID=A0ABT6FM43_9FLAO|nr:tetraacyldisaccharide 4'-kinase [Galbibacter pacificus]MDG3580812.1 tetraacyldisaccharide 4'-kinase [Galbibacter pacificus]MDG3584290.1 tetraacyldisaccharide 4'-kinase [Galbibacter pacificus]